MSKPGTDRQDRLAQALRANLHRRKAQSRARQSGADERVPQAGSKQTTAKPSTGTEQDHGQAED
ncbi:MAG: hypothetical protein EBT94_06990 [Alphaproteobacteria bacterium]|nr:hypothetical protein [Alphaproteobacteria bacterium]